MQKTTYGVIENISIPHFIMGIENNKTTKYGIPVFNFNCQFVGWFRLFDKYLEEDTLDDGALP